MKRSIILVGALALGACASTAPVSLGDSMYMMKEGKFRTDVAAIADAGKFCAEQGKNFKFIRRSVFEESITFACLNDGEHIETRAPTQRLELQVR